MTHVLIQVVTIPLLIQAIIQVLIHVTTQVLNQVLIQVLIQLKTLNPSVHILVGFLLQMESIYLSIVHNLHGFILLSQHITEV